MRKVLPPKVPPPPCVELVAAAPPPGPFPGSGAWVECAGGVADEWVTELLRQGDANVFKKYSLMKLQMKREALRKMHRRPTSPVFWGRLDEGEEFCDSSVTVSPQKR